MSLYLDDEWGDDQMQAEREERWSQLSCRCPVCGCDAQKEERSELGVRLLGGFSICALAITLAHWWAWGVGR